MENILQNPVSWWFRVAFYNCWLTINILKLVQEIISSLQQQICSCQVKVEFILHILHYALFWSFSVGRTKDYILSFKVWITCTSCVSKVQVLISIYITHLGNELGMNFFFERVNLGLIRSQKYQSTYILHLYHSTVYWIDSRHIK